MNGITAHGVLLVVCLVSTGVAAGASPKSDSCGVGCIQAVCDYYGQPFDQQEVRQALALGDFGETSLLRIKKCLEAKGFRCDPTRGSFSDVIRGKGGPFIVFIPQSHIGHFVVVFHSGETGELFVVDPNVSSVPVVVHEAAFLGRWSGVAMKVTLERGGSHAGLTIGLLAFIILVGWGSFMAFRLFSRVRYAASIAGLILVAPQTSAAEPSSGRQPAEEGPRIVSGDHIDLGTDLQVSDNGEFAVIFRWTNETAHPLSVVSTHAACSGCTSVTVDKDSAKPGEAIDFLVKVRPGLRSGNQTFATAVVFNNGVVKRFTIDCLVPEWPTVLPAVADFGVLDGGSVARRFSIASPPTYTSDLELNGEITSSSPGVACRLVEVDRVLTSLSEAERRSIVTRLWFEARLPQDCQPGRVSGLISIPLSCDGVDRVVKVPFRGRLPQSIELRPSTVVAFQSGDERPHIVMASVFRGSLQELPVSISVESDHPAVEARFLPCNDMHLNNLGDIEIRAVGRNVDAVLTVKIKLSRGSVERRLPVRVFALNCDG